MLPIQPQHRSAADICAILSGASITISFATVVEIVQLIAGLVAVVTGVLSLYFHVKHWLKPIAAPEPKRRRRSVRSRNRP